MITSMIAENDEVIPSKILKSTLEEHDINYFVIHQDHALDANPELVQLIKSNVFS